MSEHTPGPWEAYRGTEYFELKGGGPAEGWWFDHPGILYSDEDEDDMWLTEADARLIAAAPDLLAACLAMLEREDVSPGQFAVPAEYREPFDQARLAVAKAKGEVVH